MPVTRSLPPAEGLVPEVGSRASANGPCDRPRILRPLLDASRSEIEDYARENGLRWITDESNDDVSFDRNFLRREVFPLLEKRFPAYRATFSRVGRHMAEASGLLDELAEADGTARLFAEELHIEDLRRLSLPRARNLLRYTLSQRGVVLPSTVKLDDILRQLLSSHCDAKLHVIFGDVEVRCFRGIIHVRKAGKLFPRALRGAEAPVTSIAWRGESELNLPHLGGILSFRCESAAGKESAIELAKLLEQPVTIRMRQGGERLRPECDRPRRSLKNLLREASLPPWERDALPLIFSGDHLVCVPGIGTDCAYQAASGEPGLLAQWRRTEP